MNEIYRTLKVLFSNF